jgi:hypothetical protein
LGKIEATLDIYLPTASPERQQSLPIKLLTALDMISQLDYLEVHQIEPDLVDQFVGITDEGGEHDPVPAPRQDNVRQLGDTTGTSIDRESG